jgi:hypothetical protein
MIVVRTGDLLASQAQTLVNTVNCVGVMGKGIALLFKDRFPEMFDDYRRRCDAGEVRLGRPYVWRGLLPPQVLNFPTKGHWRSVSRLDDIIAGLDHLEAHYRGGASPRWPCHPSAAATASSSGGWWGPSSFAG